MSSLRKTFLIILLISLSISAQQGTLTKKFVIPSNDLSLTRSAQPHQYMDKIGSKSAVIGFENGTFELWVWPWKVFRGFDLEFFVNTSTQPILSKDIVREITVTPEATTITFVYESFTVKEIIFIPKDQPAAVVLLDVFTTTPLTIVPGFMPVMQPQWPAGIGGQSSYWDANLKGYIITEAQRRGYFVCGSPVAEQMAAPPAHMFADNPIQFKFTIEPNKANQFFYPIVIAGGHKQTRDAVAALYKDLSSNVEKYYKETYNYYKDLRNSTLQVITPDKRINLAYEFGKAALRNLLVDNPALGKGLVAGYGLSGGGGRPGFAWFFGGDAFINSLAMDAYGDFSTVKDALAFVQKWQRQEDFPIRKKNKDEVNKDVGKISHELSQSEGLIDWWNDYHYGYNHADTTPWYLVAMGDYFRKTGDVEFIKQSWKSIVQAYNWCLNKDSNGDGLMDLKGAGLGVLEFGALVKINNDLYTQGLWAQGIKEVNLMAKYTGDKEMEKTSASLLPKAKEALEKLFWMEDKGYYSFGASDDGKQAPDKNIFPTTVMMLGLLNDKHSSASVKAFNESDMVTDWGVRNLSNKSSLYEPTNYNYGTVWGFNSFFASAAQFKYHYNAPAHFLLFNTLQHSFDYGLGVFPEVFSGSINTKLGEGYHDQGFCTSGYMYPMISGMLGIETDALNNRITFAPKIPADWKFLTVNNVSIGGTILNIEYKIEKGKKLLTVNKIKGNDVEFTFEPDLAPGSDVNGVSVNGKENKFETVDNGQAVTVKTVFKVSKKNEVIVNHTPVPEIFIIPQVTPIGAINEGLKVISQKSEGKTLKIEVEGIPGKEYELGIENSSSAGKISGAVIKNNKLIISIPGNETDFIKHYITIELK